MNTYRESYARALVLKETTERTIREELHANPDFMHMKETVEGPDGSYMNEPEIEELFRKMADIEQQVMTKHDYRHVLSVFEEAETVMIMDFAMFISGHPQAPEELKTAVDGKALDRMRTSVKYKEKLIAIILRSPAFMTAFGDKAGEKGAIRTGQPTPVRFYKEGDDVLAVFPNYKQKGIDGTQNACYSHAGQHALSDRYYHYKLPLAKRQDYEPLLQELTLRGYDLVVLNKD